jgi:peptidoglycan/LPS O-acetylase OafA/YrhL
VLQGFQCDELGHGKDVSTESPVSGAQTRKGFRLDIQGIRGFALILVLACHAGVPGFAGGYVGLDIFYVLSGFLITGLILTEVDRKGSLSISRFYARRAKRLLPLAVTVLAFTVVMAAALLSPAQSQKVAGDVLAAALYFVNWHFIAEAVDYFAFEETLTSPVQHYWSLSVEEQFYLLWPLTLGAGALFARRLGMGVRRSIAILIVPIAIASLVYSLAYTPVDPRAAYFSTLTRIWELAAGGILALVLPVGLRLPRAVSAPLAGAGLAVLAVSTVAFTGETPYPGWRALLPVGATLAVIVAGTATVASGPTRLLATAPLNYLGKISYAWYLWHWPIIIFAGVEWGPLSTLDLVAATLVSGVFAVATHYTIEEPFRRSRSLGRRPRRALALGGTCTVAAVLLAFGLQASSPPVPTASPELAKGAQEVGPVNPDQESVDALRPNPVDAPTDKGQMFDDGCVLLHEETVSPECAYGDVDSETTVVAFGDSHALQWFPPLMQLAENRGWRLVGLARAGCVVGQVTYERPCNVWRNNAMRRIIRREQPELVVISTSTGGRYEVLHKGRKLNRRASQPLLIAGFARTLRRLVRSGSKVVVLRDQMLAPFSPPECVSANRDNLRNCTFLSQRRRSRAFDAFGTAKVDGAKLVDPNRILCPRNRCPSVMGRVLVYRDTYHMSATFARTLTPWLRRQLPLPLTPRE